MEGLIIWLIILAVAIYNSKRKAKPKSAQQQAQGYQTRTNGKPNMAQMQAEMARKQQELKNRLLHKPVQQAPQNSVPPQKPVQQKSDIVSRAVANVKENEVDELVKGSELMNQVNDLMIMGYQEDLSFARDFVAEGIDMLNSYQIPEL